MAKYDIVLLRPKKNGARGYLWQMYRAGIDGLTKARVIGCMAVQGIPHYEAYICKAGVKPTPHSLNALAEEVIMNFYSHNGTRFDGCVIDRQYAKDPYHRLMRVDTTGRIWVDRTIFER